MPVEACHTVCLLFQHLAKALLLLGLVTWLNGKALCSISWASIGVIEIQLHQLLPMVVASQRLS